MASLSSFESPASTSLILSTNSVFPFWQGIPRSVSSLLTSNPVPPSKSMIFKSGLLTKIDYADGISQVNPSIIPAWTAATIDANVSRAASFVA